MYVSASSQPLPNLFELWPRGGGAKHSPSTDIKYEVLHSVDFVNIIHAKS